MTDVNIDWSGEVVPRHLWLFARDHTTTREAAVDLSRKISEMLNNVAIVPFSVDSRAKSLSSYEAKTSVRDDGALKYPNPRGQIQDCVAARVLVFTSADKEKVCQVIRTGMGPAEDRDPGESKLNGYSSRHFIVGAGTWSVGSSPLAAYFEAYTGLEIQVRTIAEHAWAEYEHHVRFKPLSSGFGDLSPGDRRLVEVLFVEAAGFRQEMDRRFERIEQVMTQAPIGQVDVAVGSLVPSTGIDAAIGIGELQAWLDVRYPKSPMSTSAAYSWITEILARLGISTISAIDEQLDTVDSDHVAVLMAYKFPPSQVRRLDDDLLAAFGDTYLAANLDVQSDEPNRIQILQWRLGRIRGKIRVYDLLGTDVPAHLRQVDFSGAQAFRAVVETALTKLPLESVLIPGAVSEIDDLGSSARAVRRSFTNNIDLWLHNNLSRDFAESLIRQLFDMLPRSLDISLVKAGDVIDRAGGCDAS